MVRPGTLACSYILLRFGGIFASVTISVSSGRISERLTRLHPSNVPFRRTIFSHEGSLTSNPVCHSIKTMGKRPSPSLFLHARPSNRKVLTHAHCSMKFPTWERIHMYSFGNDEIMDFYELTLMRDVSKNLDNQLQNKYPFVTCTKYRGLSRK